MATNMNTDTDMDSAGPAIPVGVASKGGAPPSAPSGRASARGPGVAGAAAGADLVEGHGAATYARRSWPS
ncbi:hypothetical protein GCM10009646_81500 [Streptomyces aureus]